MVRYHCLSNVTALGKKQHKQAHDSLWAGTFRHRNLTKIYDEINCFLNHKILQRQEQFFHQKSQCGMCKIPHKNLSLDDKKNNELLLLILYIYQPDALIYP